MPVPKLSIIIPAYNVDRYISSCINSIISQKNDFNNCVEIIIIDDGSTDSTASILDSYRKEKSVTIITQKNQGLSCTRNTGIQLAKGEYVWFVDSDDRILPMAIYSILMLIEKESCDIIGLNVIKKKESDQSVAIESVFTNKRFCRFYNKSYNGIFLQGKIHQGMVQRYIFSHKFLTEKKLFFLPGIYHEDIDFMGRSLLYAHKIICKQIACYEYLVRNSGSIMSTRNPKSLESLCIILQSWQKLAKEATLSKHQKAALSDSIFNLTSTTLKRMQADKTADKTVGYKKIKLQKILLASFLKACPYYVSIGRVQKLICGFFRF